MARRTLRFTSGPSAGQEVEIEQEVVIGREAADLTIDDPELSRRHAAFRPAADGVEVEDLGSLNGTFVEGRRLEGPEVLTATVNLKLGTSECRLELAIPDVTRAAQVVDPDVTAPHRVAEPDVTAPRTIPDPDVTAPRAIPDPDATVKRPLAQQGPPEGSTPPAQPQAAPDGAEAQRARPPVAVIAGAVIGVIVVVILLLLLVGG